MSDSTGTMISPVILKILPGSERTDRFCWRWKWPGWPTATESTFVRWKPINTSAKHGQLITCDFILLLCELGLARLLSKRQLMARQLRLPPYIKLDLNSFYSLIVLIIFEWESNVDQFANGIWFVHKFGVGIYLLSFPPIVNEKFGPFPLLTGYKSILKFARYSRIAKRQNVHQITVISPSRLTIICLLTSF